MRAGARCCRGSSKATCIWCWAGNELTQLQLGGVAGFEALAAAFRAYAADPGLPLLMAQGAAYEILDHPVTRHDLDRVICRPARCDDVARSPYGLGQHRGA
jgi:hypothetical protein